MLVDNFNKKSLYQVMIILLTQTLLLLFITCWNEVELFGVSYDKLLNIIIFVVVGLSILSIIMVAELYKMVEYETEFKIQQVKLKENKKLIDSLRSQKHDFLNHLQTIYGMIQLDKKNQAKDYIKSLNKDLSRINFKEDILSDSILDSILISKKLEASKVGIKFDCRVEVGVEDVNFPIDKLFRVLSNLIDNAIDAVKDAEIKGIIIVKGIDKGEEYLLSVYNSRSVIEDDLKAKIFEAGFSTKGEERGFGLYIIKSLIEEFGGKLKLESKPGYGTEFLCYLKKVSVDR
ncbi:sensor histidine kinase [Orenia marismortui]|uniref:sensor histidine kinase n=1 Tax=Orenia marismortui TaxID=46469 RepID=UPI001FB8A628|nr:ATP-binding protein [Orenia marismortui]